MDVYRQHAHAHAVGWSMWHLEWCTKYRYKIFVNEQLRRLCLIALNDVAKQHRIDVVDAECDKDHVHLVVGLPLTLPPTVAVMWLKSKSARIILHETPHVWRLYRGKCLWSPGKFIASLGHITLEKAKAYLEAHHAKNLTFPRKPRSEATAEESPSKGEGLPRGGRQVNYLVTNR